jgi:hypothetical protein
MESSSSALNLRKQLEFLSENCCAGKTETWKSFLWTEILFPLKILAHQCQPAFLQVVSLKSKERILEIKICVKTQKKSVIRENQHRREISQSQ